MKKALLTSSLVALMATGAVAQDVAREDTVIFDLFEEEGQQELKAHDSLPNRNLIHWTFKQMATSS